MWGDGGDGGMPHVLGMGGKTANGVLYNIVYIQAFYMNKAACDIFLRASAKKTLAKHPRFR